MTMPERIFADLQCWYADGAWPEDTTEYIHIDKYNELEAENSAWSKRWSMISKELQEFVDEEIEVERNKQ